MTNISPNIGIILMRRVSPNIKIRIHNQMANPKFCIFDRKEIPKHMETNSHFLISSTQSINLFCQSSHQFTIRHCHTVSEWHIIPIALLPHRTIGGASIPLLQRQSINNCTLPRAFPNLLSQLLIGTRLQDAMSIVRALEGLKIDRAPTLDCFASLAHALSIGYPTRKHKKKMGKVVTPCK